jgi:hypothetical protein
LFGEVEASAIASQTDHANAGNSGEAQYRDAHQANWAGPKDNGVVGWARSAFFDNGVIGNTSWLSE